MSRRRRFCTGGELPEIQTVLSLPQGLHLPAQEETLQSLMSPEARLPSPGTFSATSVSCGGCHPGLLVTTHTPSHTSPPRKFLNAGVFLTYLCVTGASQFLLDRCCINEFSVMLDTALLPSTNGSPTIHFLSHYKPRDGMCVMAFLPRTMYLNFFFFCTP